MTRALDAVLLMAIFIASTNLGLQFLTDRQINTLGDMLPRAAMVACGHGLSTPATTTAAFEACARRDQASIACDAVAGGEAPTPQGGFTMGYRYAIYGVAAAIRVAGLSWRTLDLYAAGLFGLSMTAAYVLFRLALGRLLSVLGVIALACSSHLLALGLDLRDYGKELWFIALWAALGWLLRSGRPEASRRIYAPACAAGVLLGIGIGFRIDLTVFAPVFAATVLLGLAGWTRPALKAKAAAIGLFAATFGLIGAPILTTLAAGSNSAHVILLGMMTPFTRALGIDPPPYDLGDLYADGFAYSVIAAHASVVQHQTTLGDLGSALYDRQGSTMLADVARHFPADLLARSIGATRQALAYPFDPVARAEARDIDALDNGRIVRAFTRWSSVVTSMFAGRAVPLALVVLFAVAVRDVRLGLVGALLVLYFGGYSMLQFSRRHTFHLDVLSVGLVLLAIQALGAFARWFAPIASRGVSRDAFAADAKRRLAFALALVAGLVAAGGTTFAAARSWQTRHVTDLFDRTLAGPWADVAMTPEPLTILDRGTPTATWQGIYAANPGGWTNGVLLRMALPGDDGPTGEVLESSRSEYFLVEIGGGACSPGPVPVALKYSSTRPTIDFEYTREFDVPIAAGQPSRLLFPIYSRRGVSRFEGIAVPAGRSGCVLRAQRADPRSAAPLPILFAVLSPGWRSMPLYQRLNRTAAAALQMPVVAAPVAASDSYFFGVPLEPFATQPPDLANWTVFDGVSRTKEASGYAVQGNRTASGYQLMSPPIAVPRDRRLLVRVRGRVDSGQVCVGILDGPQQHFLLAPEGRRRIFRAGTGENTRVWIVFANCGPPPPDAGTRFTVQSVSYDLGS